MFAATVKESEIAVPTAWVAQPPKLYPLFAIVPTSAKRATADPTVYESEFLLGEPLAPFTS